MYGDFWGFLEVYCHSSEAWGQGLMETKRTGIFWGLSPKTLKFGNGDTTHQRFRDSLGTETTNILGDFGGKIPEKPQILVQGR